MSSNIINNYIKKTDERNNKPEIEPKDYYLDNRKGFVKDIDRTYRDYILKEKKNDEDLDGTYKELFPHQKFVRDYLQERSPSRGLLLFHGLGVGKTCASIAAAELLLNNKDVTVMLPASLGTNYIDEVKKCGHTYYATSQHWKFISINDLKKVNITDITIIDKAIIKKNKGLWYSVENEKNNYDSLSDDEKNQIMIQINNIISKKYNLLNYNGIVRMNQFNDLTNNGKKNIFDNNIVIIDEVHNFISRVINSSKVAEEFYKMLMNASNCKLLCLSGTPIINKPFEISLLINLLKGFTYMYELKTKSDLNEDNNKIIKSILKTNENIDYYEIDLIEKSIKIKLLPDNFVKDVDTNRITYDENKEDKYKILLRIIKKLKKEKLIFTVNDKTKKFTSLPRNEDKFNDKFIKEGKVINEELFMKRILGSVSFFEYTDSKLFPKIRKNEIVKLDFSDVQFKKYYKVRLDEIKKEENIKKSATFKNDDDEKNQIFKAFSRALCNFTFPESIERPYPSKLKLLLNEMDDIDDYNKKLQKSALKDMTEKKDKLEDEIIDLYKDLKFKDLGECSDRSRGAKHYMKKNEILDIIKKYKSIQKKLQELSPDKNYTTLKKDDLCRLLLEIRDKTKYGGAKRILNENYDDSMYNDLLEEVLDKISDPSQNYLTKDLGQYSPKFKKMLELLKESEGTSLIYSQFRNVEGLGIFKRVLNANDYAQLKLKKTSKGYELDMNEEDYNKKKYVEFTGDKEMTKVILNIFNNNLDELSEVLREQINNLHSDKNTNNGNLRGSIVKILMITQSGSEGISLKNVRQVHLIEPYWNMIRIDQVIGRAVRTGSHLGLPVKDRNIDVYRYLCKFSKKHLEDRKVKNMDFGKTSDEVIHELAIKKDKITKKFLELLKSSAVDCYLHKENHKKVECFSYPVNVGDDKLMVYADIEKEDMDNIGKTKVIETELIFEYVKIKGKNYYILKDSPNEKTGQLFDYNEYSKFSNIKFVGLLIKNDKGNLVLRLIKDENARSKVVPVLEEKKEEKKEENKEEKKELLEGTGELRGYKKKVKETINKYSENEKYNHKIVEHGGNPNCSYCTMAAIINQINKLKNKKERYNFQDIRNMISEKINEEDDDFIRVLYQQEFGDLNNEQERIEFNAQLFEKDIKEIKEEIIQKIKNDKWGTEYDFNVFSNKFDIGIIMIDDKGELYNMAKEINKKEYYGLVYYTGDHFQTIGIKKKEETTYKYVFECKDIPKPIINLINDNSKDQDDFEC